MNTYQHTQRGPRIIVFLIGLSIILTTVALLKALPILFVAAAITLLSIWLFSSLTIAINDGRLSWHFGCGIIRKNVALADVASAKVVRTNVLEGWGIHLSRYGWLYNISGFGAVAITLKNGKRFALGSDEPEILAREISGTIKA